MWDWHKMPAEKGHLPQQGVGYSVSPQRDRKVGRSVLCRGNGGIEYLGISRNRPSFSGKWGHLVLPQSDTAQ